MARRSDWPRRGRVVAAVGLWATLLLGLGSVAQGVIALIDVVIPSHRQAGGVSGGLVDIAMGGLIGLPAVLQSKWFTRPAGSASAQRSWMPWVLWTIIALGIGLIALAAVALLGLLSPHRPKPSAAAVDALVIGLGGLICFGPALRLRGFGLLPSPKSETPTSAELGRPLTGGERARLAGVISGMVLVVVGSFVVITARAGVGWGLFTALALGAVVGISAGWWSAWLRSHPSQDPVPFVPPPSSTSSGSAVTPLLTLRATASSRWVTLVVCLVLAGGLIGLGVRSWIVYGHVDLLWAPTVIAALFVAMAYFYWSMYIQADDTTIVFRFVLTRRYERREVVGIRIGRFAVSYYGGSGRPVSFIRPDGSVVFSTTFYWWGRDELEELATYLGVPIQLAG